MGCGRLVHHGSKLLEQLVKGHANAVRAGFAGLEAGMVEVIRGYLQFGVCGIEDKQKSINGLHTMAEIGAHGNVFFAWDVSTTDVAVAHWVFCLVQGVKRVKGLGLHGNDFGPVRCIGGSIL